MVVAVCSESFWRVTCGYNRLVPSSHSHGIDALIGFAYLNAFRYTHHAQVVPSCVTEITVAFRTAAYHGC